MLAALSPTQRPPAIRIQRSHTARFKFQSCVRSNCEAVEYTPVVKGHNRDHRHDNWQLPRRSTAVRPHIDVTRSRWTRIVALAGTASLWALVLTRPPYDLRSWLTSDTFWILEGLAILACASTIASWPVLMTQLRLVSPEYRGIAAASLLALGLCGWLAPHTNRIYYDEQIYQHIGQSLNDSHTAQMCSDGTVEYGRLQCNNGEFNKEPYGYPHILSWLYRIAGTRDGLAHHWNVATSGLLVWIVALSATLLWRDATAGTIAGLTMAVLPQQLLWGHTAAAEPSAELFAALSMLAAIVFVRSRRTATLVWCLAVTEYGIHMRPESLLIAVPLGACVLLEAGDELAKDRAWWALAGACVLALPLGAHLAAVRNESWGTDASRFSLIYLVPNLQVNGWFYLWDERFPPVVTLLALIGVVGRARRALWLPLWFVVSAGIYVLFYAGSYNYGADVRYSLLTYPPLALLAGGGAASVVQRLSPRVPSRLSSAGIVALMLVSFTWAVPLVRAEGEEGWDARADVGFARAMTSSLPPNSVVLTHNPNMFLLWGQSAAQLSIAAQDAQYARQVFFSRYSGGVYLHWNFWCNVDDPLQAGSCRQVLEAFPHHQLIRETRLRASRYAFYRLSP
jgi:hypothetical protein